MMTGGIPGLGNLHIPIYCGNITSLRMSAGMLREVEGLFGDVEKAQRRNSRMRCHLGNGVHCDDAMLVDFERDKKTGPSDLSSWTFSLYSGVFVFVFVCVCLGYVFDCTSRDIDTTM